MFFFIRFTTSSGVFTVLLWAVRNTGRKKSRAKIICFISVFNRFSYKIELVAVKNKVSKIRK
jgi:hypothetical protein